MDEEVRKAVLREQLLKKNTGKNTIASRYQIKYPDSAEREYLRLVNIYMDIEKQVLLKYISELKRIINAGDAHYNMDAKRDNNKKRKLARFENVDNTLQRIRLLFESIAKELESTIGLFNLVHELNRVAALNHKLTIKEWKKTISKTLGIDILEDYYSGNYYREMLVNWVSENVELIKTVPSSSLGKMKEIVYKDFMDGKNTTDIVKELQRQYGMDKKHARLIARDQTAKLNAAIDKSQQLDAGVDRYEWSDSRDIRVRKSHKRLNGHIFYWNNPPETEQGRHCHPGEDFQCRCCALPIFDIDKLDLPI